MDHANIESDTLAHIDDRYYLGAHCRKCGHHARLSIAKLKAHLGDGFRLAKIRDRLKCERCGDRRQIVVRLLNPSESQNRIAFVDFAPRRY